LTPQLGQWNRSKEFLIVFFSLEDTTLLARLINYGFLEAEDRGDKKAVEKARQAYEELSGETVDQRGERRKIESVLNIQDDSPSRRFWHSG
jgi:hypothetical protein